MFILETKFVAFRFGYWNSVREGFKNKIKKKYGIFHTFLTPPLRWGKVWNLFMIFFDHPRDKFALFFDAFHNIWDQGKRGIMVF